MDEKIVFSNVRVASPATFFPHPTDPKKNKLMVNVIKNRGKDKTTGKSYSEVYSLVFWNRLASVGACHFPVGRALNIEAVPRTYSRETGKTKPSGKAEIISQTTWHVRSFEFGPDSMKELLGRVTGNIALLKQQGLLPATCTVTAEMLLVSNRQATVDYDPNAALVTGMYGHSKVYIKGTGFITPTGAAAIVQPAKVDGGESIESLKAKLALMEADGAKAATAGAEAGTVIDPMAGAK